MHEMSMIFNAMRASTFEIICLVECIIYLLQLLYIYIYSIDQGFTLHFLFLFLGRCC
jgi:hypothetical protein